ncbi:translocation/assembly module TamB domain-containing protein [Pelosinus sp. IPA-1]|uniref:translocation/assembly module TamB domain-containing protein n=1 Tax=Pelosinus sp. IPA-1 TaxID=3029569 RepID=UPI0024361925|nr:translocation/assembly module TamB domain-containing protein [Pelosinus sp. IPA-1]GMB01317.1 hypothetical protein PIPA1_41160 [Pelosinus sp. IPA-1]
MKEKIIAVIIAGMLLVAGSVFWLTRSQEVMTGAQHILSEELASALGSLVTVGDIELTSYNRVTIHNITIYDKQAEKLATSDKIIVSYSPWNILRGKNVVGSISELQVENPILWLTQRKDGHWNIEDILNQSKTTQSSLTSKVKLVEGKAIVNAYSTTWEFEALNGSLNFANKPRIELQLQAFHNGAALKVRGAINTQGRSTVTLTVDQLMLADYQALCPADGPINLVGGSAEKVEVIAAYDKGNIEWAGEAQLKKADVDVDGVPLRQIDGGITFTNKNIYVFAKTKIFDQPIAVRGTVRTDASEPILDLTVASTDFDPRVLGENIPINGKLSFEAGVTGITSNPKIIGNVEMKTGEVAGYPVYDVQAKLDMADKKITIHQLDADVFSGHVTISGQVEPETTGYQLALKGQHIDTQNLAEMIPSMRGYVDGTAVITGTGPLANAKIQGTVAMGQGEYSGTNFTSLASGFYYQSGNVTVDYFNVGLGQGVVTAKGLITGQNMQLQVYGQGIPLQLIGEKLGKEVLGVGQFDGEIRGTLAAPELSANFMADNGEILYQPFTQIVGNIHLTPQQIALQNVEMTYGVTKHKIQGTLELTGQQEINMVINSQRARAETLITLLAPGEKLTGNVDNEMTLKGPLENLTIDGHITLTDGSFRGQLLAKGTGSYKRELGITTINNFVIQSLSTQIQLSGSISPNNDLNFDVVAQDIDIGKLNITTKIPYTAAGKAKFKGKLTGTPAIPNFTGELSADTLFFNNQSFTGVLGTIAVYGNEVNIPAVSFQQGKGKFNFSGGFTLDSGEVYGTLDVENGELKPIIAMCKLGDKEVAGLLNGQIKMNGTMDKPIIHVTGDLKQGSIKNYPLEAVTIDVGLDNNKITIYDFTVHQGTGVVMAQGTADLNKNGPLDLEVGGRDIDAGLVAAFFNTNVKPTGKLEFAAQISGVSDNPHTALSLDINNGGVGNATFDSLYGLLILDNDIIHVDQILLKKGPYQASAYGMIPVAALSQDGRQEGNRGEEMNLKVRLDQANLSILSLLTKEVAWAQGATQGEITVTGTLGQPILMGNITVNDGTLKLTALKDPIQKVGVDIAFEGDKINIKKFDGHMGTGLYSVTGTTRIKGLGLADYDISLLLDKPVIRSKYFTGPIDGKLMLSQKGDKAKLSGKLLFENDMIDIPTIPDMKEADLNMDLDVEVAVGKKVRFYNPYLYDILAAGRVKLGGSMTEPDVTGHIIGIRGTVSYLRTQFKVNEASVDFRQYASFEPIVKLSAQTRLQQTVVNLNVSGPARAMQFNLTSEPAMSQQEILSLLTLRSHYFDKQNGGNTELGRDELVSALDAGLQMRFVSEVEGNLRNALGLDEFRFVRDTTSNIVKKSYADKDENSTVNREVYNLQMSKYLTDKLLINYIVGVDHTKSELSFRYSVNRRLNITGSIDDQNQTWLGAEARFRF